MPDIDRGKSPKQCGPPLSAESFGKTPPLDEAALLHAQDMPPQNKLVHTRGYGIMTFTHDKQNGRLIFPLNSAETVVVDPGGRVKEIIEAAETEKVCIKEIWITHSHPDHILGVRELQKKTGARITASVSLPERLMRWQLKRVCKVYGDGGYEEVKACPSPAVRIRGLTPVPLVLGDNIFQAVPTPGHSPGHLCFWDEQKRILLCGDALFARGGGRSDFPFGNAEAMERTMEWFYSLPDDTLCLSGHGPDFLLGGLKAVFKTSRDCLLRIRR